MARVTYSLDDATVAAIRRMAARLRRPQSQIVREAVAVYAASADRLSEADRARQLATLERLRHRPATRPGKDVDAELADVRAARRSGGRRHLTP